MPMSADERMIVQRYDIYVEHIKETSHGNWEPLAAAILTLADVIRMLKPWPPVED
jgi:hypothetical protein